MEAVTPSPAIIILGISISSTVVATWFAMALIIAMALIARAFKPTILEMVVEFLNNLISDVMGDRDIQPFVPMIGTMAIFLVVLNTFSVFPVFSSPTSDINTTIALALVVFVAVHIFGIRSKGVWKYFKDMASPIFLLPLEIIGQVSRTLSLALRLFGNILSGDLIVAIILSLIPLLVPLPLMGLGFLIGALQAYVFVALTSVYISSAIEVETEQ